MFYDFDSILNYPTSEGMRDYDRMTDKELIGMCIMRFVAFLALIGVLAIVCILIKLFS